MGWGEGGSGDERGGRVGGAAAGPPPERSDASHTTMPHPPAPPLQAGRQGKRTPGGSGQPGAAVLRCSTPVGVKRSEQRFKGRGLQLEASHAQGLLHLPLVQPPCMHAGEGRARGGGEVRWVGRRDQAEGGRGGRRASFRSGRAGALPVERTRRVPEPPARPPAAPPPSPPPPPHTPQPSDHPLRPPTHALTTAVLVKVGECP